MRGARKYSGSTSRARRGGEASPSLLSFETFRLALFLGSFSGIFKVRFCFFKNYMGRMIATFFSSSPVACSATLWSGTGAASGRGRGRRRERPWRSTGPGDWPPELLGLVDAFYLRRGRQVLELCMLLLLLFLWGGSSLSEHSSIVVNFGFINSLLGGIRLLRQFPSA